MKQKIKNIFSVSSKKALGKLGLFLIFGFFVININFYCKNEFDKNIYLGNVVFVQLANAEENSWIKEVAEGAKKGTVQLITHPDQYLKDRTKDVFSAVKYAGKEGASSAADWVLSEIDEVVKYLVGALGGFIDTVLSQQFFDVLVKENVNVYRGWTIVRDMLNMFFMLLLLFSAFATIFQVEKYHLRKVIIMLIVMALLVNFSFPITGFIIDFSNSAMYFLLESTFKGSISPTAKLAETFSYGHVLANTANNGGTATSALMTLIFDFIMLVTFFALLINLLIRILAFMILMILSPAGFVFAFFPYTKSVASRWWGALFKYAFLGPIMAFFLYLATSIFVNTSSVNLTFTGSVIAFLVPIIFLWMGLIISQQFGGDGSGMAMNLAKRVGGNIKTYGQKAAWGGTKMVGRGVDNAITGGYVGGTFNAVKNRWKQVGDDYNSKVNKRTAEMGDRFGVKGANEKLVQDTRKKWKDENGVSDTEAARIDNNGTNAEKMALALERAENKGFDDSPAIALKQYEEGLKALSGSKVYEELFKRNVTKKNIDLVINSEIKSKGATSYADIKNISDKEFKKLDPTNWKDQNINRIVALNTAQGHDGIVDSALDTTFGYSDSAQKRMSSEMKGDKYATGKKANMWV